MAVGLGNRAGVILLYLVFYMPINVLLYTGYLKITYADSMGKNLKELHTVLNTYYKEAVGGSAYSSHPLLTVNLRRCVIRGLMKRSGTLAMWRPSGKDAFAYAVKREGTSCFFVEPDIWELLHEIEKNMTESESSM